MPYSPIMLRKLFGWSSSLQPPAAPELREPRDSDAMDVEDKWAVSLPIDLILEIFLHMEPAAVICCAGVCKSWRRVIIGNATILGPHLDRFGPSLLLGIFHGNTNRYVWRLRHTPGPFQSAIPSSNGGGSGNHETPAYSFIPGAAPAAFPTLLSSRDGFLLLTARSLDRLCLCNPVTGYCTIVPAAAGNHNEYFLLTAGSNDSAVHVLAVHTTNESGFTSVEEEERLAYQVFSNSGEGVWGPVVQCSGQCLEAGSIYVRLNGHRSTAVGRDTVYWLAGPGLRITCVFALDVFTGRTWRTEVPLQCRRGTHDSSVPILAMSGDGQLSLVQSLRGPHIKLWVLSDDAQWTVQRTISIDLYNLLPRCPLFRCNRRTDEIPLLTAFCPRSRCVVAIWSNQEFLVDVEGDGSRPYVRRLGNRKEFPWWPYEMNTSSTYISKMKHF